VYIGAHTTLAVSEKALALGNSVNRGNPFPHQTQAPLPNTFESTLEVLVVVLQRPLKRPSNQRDTFRGLSPLIFVALKPILTHLGEGVVVPYLFS
jgi:hypothetical protein